MKNIFRQLAFVKDNRNAKIKEADEKKNIVGRRIGAT